MEVKVVNSPVAITMTRAQAEILRHVCAYDISVARLVHKRAVELQLQPMIDTLNELFHALKDAGV